MSKSQHTLESIANLTLEMDDVQTALDYMRQRAADLTSCDEINAIYRRLTYGVIRCVELDKKCAKRYIPNFVSSLQDLQDNQKTIDVVYETLISVPILLQARWDLITLLTTAQMCPVIDEVLFKEVMACGPDQDLSARCSSTVLTMATHPEAFERAAQIIFRGLTSPICAVRNNVHRAWLCRIINIKSSEKCVRRILELCRAVVIADTGKMWPVAFRETPGLSSADLEWKATLDEEPYDSQTFTLLAYFSVLIALKNQSSQVRVKLEHEDPVVTRGIEYFVAIAAKHAIVVCAKYKVYPKNLEKAILFESENARNPDIFEIVDEDMQKTFTPEGQTQFTKEKLRFRMGKQPSVKEEKTKFYPAEDDGNLKVEVNLHTETNSMKTLKRFLEIQHPTQEYPSVAAVMEHLSSQNIDERLFSQKICVVMDIVVSQLAQKKFTRKTVTEFLFTTITKIPLRAVVDYAGEILRKQCREDQMFNEKIFIMSMELLEKNDENARPLSLVHCFLATCDVDETKIGRVWKAVKTLKKGEKKRKMSEMLAKVVQHADVAVDITNLHDMVLCSLGLKSDFDIESTQLFVAATSKFLDFRAETERVLLFQAIYENPTILELIDQILSHPPSAFSKPAFQMVLYFFTRFHFGALQFYPFDHLQIIIRITSFCHWCIRKFAGEPMLLSIAVDAICGYLPWEYVRERALGDKELITDDQVEKLICQNLRHHRLWVLLSEHDKEERLLTLEDIEQFPFADLIVEVLKNQDKGVGVLSALAGKLLERMEKNTSEHIHADSMAFGLLCDKMFEIIDKADAMKDKDPDYKKQYPTPLLMNLLLLISDGFNRRTEKDLRMANSWLGKGLGKMQMLQEKRNCVYSDMFKC